MVVDASLCFITANAAKTHSRGYVGLAMLGGMAHAPCTRQAQIWRTLLGCAVLAGLTGCASVPMPHGKVLGASFEVQEVVQSDSNRVMTLAMRDNMDSLMLLMDKLYLRNPGEWRKTAGSRAAAADKVTGAILGRQAWPDLQGQRDIAGLSKALSPDFAGDRVAAFIYALGDMLLASHGDKTRFTLIDSVHPQYIYNAARNVEIANWVLNTRKTPQGQPLLLSNHLSEHERNLSFEREMGKLIGRLDLVASFGTERVRRAAIGFGQTVVAGPFLPFLPVR